MFKAASPPVGRMEMPANVDKDDLSPTEKETVANTVRYLVQTDRDKQLPYERFEISRSQWMGKGGDASENGGACWGEHLTLSTLPQPQSWTF
ncbi:hypothetical protein CEP52_012597 [Fusarium oligoseptatum]|uniref:Uncharacterized protein n=1 Tax=Fusarium oligoseptatum TaxID=2604345 RepID=A0A428SXF4_9HYPO|nr:hypothetical protein CEP52_012597 [Fusarium oligoseptatum]